MAAPGGLWSAAAADEHETGHCALSRLLTPMATSTLTSFARASEVVSLSTPCCDTHDGRAVETLLCLKMARKGYKAGFPGSVQKIVTCTFNDPDRQDEASRMDGGGGDGVGRMGARGAT